MNFYRQQEEANIPPTERKLRRAKEQGYIPKSPELSLSLTFLAQALTIALCFLILLNLITTAFRFPLINIENIGLNQVFGVLFKNFLLILLPIFLISLVASIFAHILQAGSVRFYPRLLIPSAARIKSNFDRFLRLIIPSRLSLFEYSKTAVKFLCVFLVGYFVIKNDFSNLLWSVDFGINNAVLFLFKLILSISLKVGLLLFVIGLLDYLYQRYEWKKSLMMTPHELREEYKLYEGDPRIRAQLRRRYRQLARIRMWDALKTADVVITNPVEIAVALKYRPAYMRAPMVVAKGRNLMAERIVEVAREYNIPIIQNRPLAEALFTIEVGDEIPPALYEPVAQILAQIYRQSYK